MAGLNLFKKIESIPIDHLKLYEKAGYSLIQTNKKTCKVGIRKSSSEVFEDRVACLFKEYLEFSDVYVRETFGKHRVSCVAVNDDLIVIVDAISNDEDVDESDIKQHIDGFKVKLQNISNSLSSDMGYSQERRFIICLDGVKPTDDSIQYAQDEGIIIFESQKVNMLEDFTESVGSEVTRQHLYKTLNVEQRIITGDNHAKLRYPVIKSEYTKDVTGVYSAYLSAKDLLNMTYIHRISTDSIEDYQRILRKTRLKEIAEYINDGNKFTTSVLIALETDDVWFKLFGEGKEQELAFGLLHLPKLKSIARIIDGQHRIFSYLWADKKHLNDKVPTVIISGLSKTKQSKLFVDINRNQKPVDPSTILSILANTDPYGIGFIPTIVNKMNSEGLFKDRVKVGAINNSVKSGSKLTINGMVKDIERRFLLSEIKKPKIDINDVNLGVKDMNRAKDMIEGYFSYIVNSVDSSRRNILERMIYSNIGFSILSYVFYELLKYKNFVINDNTYETIIGPAIKKFLDTNNDSYVNEMISRPGESSFKKSAYEIIVLVHDSHPGYGGEFIESISRQKDVESPYDKNINNIRKNIDSTELHLKEIIKDKLKSNDDALYDILRSYDKSQSERLKNRVAEKKKGYDSNPTSIFSELVWENIQVVVKYGWNDVFHDFFGAKYDLDRVVGDIDTIKRFRNNYLGHISLESERPSDTKIQEVEACLKRMMKVFS